MQSLDDIFEGKSADIAPAPAPEPTPEPIAEEPQGVKQEPEAPKAESPSPEVTQPRMVPLEALEAERKRRQEAEARIQQPEQKKSPDIFEDPEGYQKHMEATLQQATFNERCNISQFLARRDYPDLDQKLETFKTLLTDYPQYAQQIAASPSPYHEMADIVTKHEKLKALENVDQVEAKLRAEIEAKVRAEFEAKAKQDAQLKASIPPSIVDLPSKGSVKGNEWSGPTPLKSLFKG